MSWIKTLIILCFSSAFVYAQDSLHLENNNTIELFETSEENRISTEDINNLIDERIALLERPVNINTAHEIELVECGLFNHVQVTELLKHRKEYGLFVDKKELRTLTSFSNEQSNSIQPYISISTTFAYDHLFFNGYHQFVGRTKLTSKPLPSSYLGDPSNSLFRYIYQVPRGSSIGFTYQKDPGELWFDNNQPILNKPEFLSFHIALKTPFSKSALIVGDYRLQFGQGLHFWNSYAFSKSGFPLSVQKQAPEIAPYTSSNESNNLRGVVFQWRNRFNPIVFASIKRVDGTLVHTDSSVHFSNFREAETHRTENEIKNKNNIKEQIYGFRTSYRGQRLKIGISSSYHHYSKQLIKSNQPYNQQHFSGNQYSTSSLDYDYYAKYFTLFGELSTLWGSDIAFINGILVPLSSHIKFIASYRHYGISYFSRYTNSFGELSTNSNENAFYLGTTVQLNRNWKLKFYSDFYKHPWLRFNTAAPSRGHDLFGQIVYLRSNRETYLRIGFESKQQNNSSEEISGSTNHLINRDRLRLRLHHKLILNEHFSIKNRIEWTRFKLNHQESGILLYQDVNWKSKKGKYTLAIRYAFFKTDSFSTSIYAYENDVLYSFSVPAYHGIGTRYYINFRYRINRHISLWLKASHTSSSNPISSLTAQIKVRI